MHTKVYIPRPKRVFPRTEDNKIKCLRQIDQYPVIRGNLGLSGYAASDVSLFNKLANNVQSTQKFAALMNHVHMLQAEKNQNKGKTVQQMIDSVLPAYIQLPAETVRFYEYLEQSGVTLDGSVTKDEPEKKEELVEPVAPKSE